jgi:hypothetical protein
MGKYFRIPHKLGSPSSYMTLQLLHSEFPYIWGKFYFLFYQCIPGTIYIQCSIALSTDGRTACYVRKPSSFKQSSAKKKKKTWEFYIQMMAWGLPKGRRRIFSSNKKCASQLTEDSFKFFLKIQDQH